MRYMDSLAGEFTSRDPVGLWGNEINLGNARTFAGNNPLRFTDAMGLSAVDPQSDEQIKKEQVKKDRLAYPIDTGCDCQIDTG